MNEQSHESEHQKKLDSIYTTYKQNSKYDSPWSIFTRIKVLFWHIVWLFLFRPSPKPFKRWRNFLLKIFGAKILGSPFISSSARIKMPWNLYLSDHSCLGENVIVYNLAPIKLEAECTVAQECYLCTGSHDLEQPSAPLIVAPIHIGKEAFIGVRSLILPGVSIGNNAVVGGGSVVTKNVAENTIVAGNPATIIRHRNNKE